MNDVHSGGLPSVPDPECEAPQAPLATTKMPLPTATTMCNANSASVASLSSNDSGESYVVEREEMVVLSNEARDLEEALGRLSVLFQTGVKFNELTKVEAFDRLGEVLKILRHMMTEYPALQSDELITTGGKLIKKVKTIDWEQGSADEQQDIQDVQDILELIASTLSTRVTEFLVGDLENLPSSSPSTKKLKSGTNLATGYYDNDSLRICDAKVLGYHQIDAVLLHNDLGVDLALARIKAWSKYAKDVLNYVEKKTTMEFEFARNLAKLAQTTRPILNEESFLPFKSIYCISLDQDLEMCGSMQATCSQIQGYKFSEPLTLKRAEHEKTRKALKERWEKERKRIQEAVASLLKAKAIYLQRTQEYDRCRETLKAAESEGGSEKFEKKKRLEEEALQKLAESELLYKQCVMEANERQHHLLAAKADILKQVRELNVQCDLTMKMATVSYFQLQHTMNAPVPGQYQTLCESSRLYEPGSQFMEYVKSLPQPNYADSNQVVTQDPFTFEPHRGTAGHAPLATTDETELNQLPQERHSTSGSIPNDVDPCPVADADAGLHKVNALGPDDIESLIEWTSAMRSVSNPEGSDTDSADSGKSSPTTNNHSALPNNNFHQDHRQALIYFDNDRDSTSPVGKDTKGAKPLGDSYSPLGQRSGPLSPTAPSQRQMMSKAAVTHRFRKLKTPSKCRECDSYVYFQGYDCQDCGLSSHKKCLETLALQCGHKRLPRKMTTFGVDLSQHLSDTNSTVPPLVCKCVHEIETRGIKFKGLYRVSSAKPKVERLCQTFENGAELVDLTDIHVPVIANVLKLYLRQLPEPLITSPLYRDFIRIAELCPAPGGDSTISEETAVAELRELCRRLPKTHYHTLGFLMHHIKRVAEEHESNNMPVSNLAIVFGPTLLWSNKGNTSLTTVMETPHQARAIELISIHASDIFGPPESVIPKDYSRYTTNPPHHSHSHPHPHPHHRTTIKEDGRPRSTCGGKAYKSGRRRRQILSAREANHGSRHRVELFKDESSHSGQTIGSQESGEDIFGVTASDENEDNAEPIPPFLLPDAVPGKSKKSPAKFRHSSSPPKIIKQSLKNFSGLEGVTPGMLSTQDSLEVVQKLGLKPDGSMIRRSVQQEMSVPVTASSLSDDRGGKSLKKHSLDEEFFVTSDQMKMAHFNLNPSDPSSASSAGSTTAVTSPRTNLPHYRSQQIVPVGRSSLRIGSPSGGSSSNIQSSSTSVRSCSLSDEAQSVAISHRHRLRGLTSSASHAGMASTLTTSGAASSSIAHSSSLSHSLPTEVMTIDENRFKIRVPGLQPQKMAVRSHLAAAKQASLDKDDR